MTDGAWNSAGIAVGTARDPRVDVLRGLSLMMIFADHIPGDDLSWVTMHNYGFSDAAEVFVMLAGFSSMMAYGKTFQRAGARAGLVKIAARCLRIYVFQIGLVAVSMGAIWLWTRHFGLAQLKMAPLIQGTVRLRYGFALAALPDYYDILPLYIVLLAVFPLIYLAFAKGGARWGAPLALAGSTAVWLVAYLDRRIDLPNVMNGQGWYFDPFSWQLLFTLGAALALWMSSGKGSLPHRRWAAALAWTYLAFAFLETFNFKHWGLPDLKPFAMDAPEKSRLSLLRVADISALFYLLLTSSAVLRLCRSVVSRPLEACGRHSLEVFSLGCLLGLFARLLFRTYGMDTPMQLLVNLGGAAGMIALAMWMERGKARAAPPNTAAGELAARAG